MKPWKKLAGAALFCLAAVAATPSMAQSCRWDGTAPLCNGKCSGDENELTRLGSMPGGWTAPFVNQSPPFASRRPNSGDFGAQLPACPRAGQPQGKSSLARHAWRLTTQTRQRHVGDADVGGDVNERNPFGERTELLHRGLVALRRAHQ